MNFFTYTLGLRLVKKTVNQDDIQTYHLFFADDEGNAGTDMTFFDFPGIQKGVHGTNEISKTSFRVPSDDALEYWVKRFDKFNVKHKGIKEQFGKKVLSFVDFDDQQYQLISDENNEGVESGTPWQKGPIPLEFAITGLDQSIFARPTLIMLKKLWKKFSYLRKSHKKIHSIYLKWAKEAMVHKLLLNIIPFFHKHDKALELCIIQHSV